MIDKILGIIGVFKELPEAIGYSVYGPIEFSLPKELKEVIGQAPIKEIDTITSVYVQIDNFTNREITEIAILYNGKFHYTPNFSFERRDVQPISEHNAEDKTLLIRKLPPKESVRIEVFLDEDESFVVNSIMTKGRLVTKWMQKISDIYRYPKLALMSFFIICFLLLMFAIVGHSVYTTSLYNNNYRIINEAMSDWDGCTPTPFVNTIESEKLLKRKFQQQLKYEYLIYKLNKVNSFDELKIKDMVILCEPKNP